MHQAGPLHPVVTDVLGPYCALDVHEDGRGGALQLDHHYRAQVSTLISGRESKGLCPAEAFRRQRVTSLRVECLVASTLVGTASY